MARQAFEIASALTAASVRHLRKTLALWLALTAALAFQAAQLRSEVGYAAYFGPHDAAVERLESFFSEFDSGLHVLVAFSCPGKKVCASFREGGALELLGSLQAEIDALPNVLRTRSLLNTPIVIGPLESHTIGQRVEGRYALAPDWEPLIARSAGEPFLAELVISKDERTAGVVVELQSLDSDRVREFVHRLLDLVPRFERTPGGEVFVAGDRGDDLPDRARPGRTRPSRQVSAVETVTRNRGRQAEENDRASTNLGPFGLIDPDWQRRCPVDAKRAPDAKERESTDEQRRATNRKRPAGAHRLADGAKPGSLRRARFARRATRSLADEQVQVRWVVPHGIAELHESRAATLEPPLLQSTDAQAEAGRDFVLTE